MDYIVSISGLDFPGNDYKRCDPIEVEQQIRKTEKAVAGNSLGFLKTEVDTDNLALSPWIGPNERLLVNLTKVSGLEELADHYKLDKLLKYGHNYIPTYARIFYDRRKTANALLEIGIGCVEAGEMAHCPNDYRTGNSLRMWRDFFTNAIVHGVDYHKKAMITGEERIRTYCADQSSKVSLGELKKIGPLDIIIDDGSHVLEHQVLTFLVMESQLTFDGIYVIEDVWTQNIEGWKSLHVFPEEKRQIIRDKYWIEYVDSRGAHNNYNDFMVVFTRKHPQILINGISGLANNLFQVLTAIPYAEKHGCRIVLNATSPLLLYGTSNEFGRNVSRKVDGKKQSYLKTILSKFRTTIEPFRHKTIELFNDNLTENRLSTIGIDEKIIITGYSQNIELFHQYRNVFDRYLELQDPDIMYYVNAKYQIDPRGTNVMVGIRIGEDFKGMKKITSDCYTRALEMIPGPKNIFVISDVESGWERMVGDLGNIVHVKEDDIVQIYVGLQCNHFICSESTYHFMIAYLAYCRDPHKRVIIFEDTDMTNRKLCHILGDLIRVKRN